MAPDFPRLVRRLTFGLLALASAATEIAADETRPVLSGLGLAAVWVGLAAVLGLFARPPGGTRRVPPRSVFFLLLLLGAAPFVIEPLRRRWTGDGYPLEIQMVFALRNLGLGLAAFAVWPLCLRLAVVVSLFLILFTVSLTTHPALLWLLGLYSATGSVWLMLVYWAGLRRGPAVPDVAVLEVQPGRHRLPWPATFIILGPNLPWPERVLAALLAALGWLGGHAWAVGSCLVGLAALWWKRRELLDVLAVALFRLFPGRCWRLWVRRVLWLLERRGRWAGRPRPASQTPSAWLPTVLPVGPDPGGEVRQLTRMAEWCAYAPDLTPPWPAPEIRDVCRRVLGVWTLRRWRAVSTPGAARGGGS